MQTFETGNAPWEWGPRDQYPRLLDRGIKVSLTLPPTFEIKQILNNILIFIKKNTVILENSSSFVPELSFFS